ncbi:MAG TPA: universal stress protein [Candidatus Sulfotelmatobacter sp.]|nr:universal stress protein [Candidatus Sulfotelmatobacter sp.]
MQRQRHSRTMSGYRRILWPTDFSVAARAALPHVRLMAELTGGEVVLLHVLPTPVMYANPDVAPALVRLDPEIRATAARELERLAKLLRTQGVKVKSLVEDGLPVERILRVARRLRCDLILLATHGRSGLAHVLLGSVAENVVRRAPCPVLVVRSKGSRR